jgi:hypothetical protein
MKCCSHELAHYLQFSKGRQSSCQSDWGTNKYVDWLAQEHEQFTQQIYQMIKNSAEYSVWERQWKEV